ncbi:hypothetical protein ABIC83_002688 [Roseateles asaccharophilus]|uniref:hypothetical protein n=1 Tax=Roseateles asaccharophilus TaxID=582607 RepID=UPI0038379F1D
MDMQGNTGLSALASQLLAEARLPVSSSTRRLLLQAAGALTRVTQAHSELPDFAATSWMPGEETLAPLIAAALDHAADANCMAYLVKVPETTPELLIALGERQQLIEILTLKSEPLPEARCANDGSGC